MTTLSALARYGQMAASSMLFISFGLLTSR
jgi:hypothetical protein